MEFIMKNCFCLNSSVVHTRRMSKILSAQHIKHYKTNYILPTQLVKHNTRHGSCLSSILSQRLQTLTFQSHALCLHVLRRNYYSNGTHNKKIWNDMEYNTGLKVYRNINTKESHQSKHKEFLSDGALACRLANENGYLSWCRNSYLLTAVSLAMLFQGHNYATDLAAYVCILTAGINITWGSLVFIYNIIAHRKRVQMSIPVALFTVTAVMVQLFLFLAALVIFTADCNPNLMTHRKPAEEKSDENTNLADDEYRNL